MKVVAGKPADAHLRRREGGGARNAFVRATNNRMDATLYMERTAPTKTPGKLSIGFTRCIPSGWVGTFRFIGFDASGRCG